MEATIERILLRPSEAAQAIGISRSRVYELISSGVLPSLTVGGVKRIPVEELRAWVHAQIAAGKETTAA